MSRVAKQIKITTSGKPMVDDFFALLVARALANRPMPELVACDGQLVEKKNRRKRR